MQTKHTPGPWRADGPDGFQDFNILHGGDSLAVAAVISNMREPPEIEANASLIAAAPDLLAALQRAVSRWTALADEPFHATPDHQREHAEISKARATILKATQPLDAASTTDGGST